ncbi:endospore germination permease [Paenibacillus allorhizosphaerae]|uniref:Uncharacterized protein n=1 Tax=Paenibacillus allorhizosphaerae TaxID=2849866 RepID=A0ABN7TRX7_9BACL|nr:endospore germination permease [Paenibacillus allorhizosphaerae]CAG7653448.1 hypothetical protein PAECIP111802_05485 [Paenibacillus allorhizosphaerae]
MNKNIIVINERQYAWLIGALITGGGLVSIQHELVRIARMDAWFSFIIPLVYILLIAYVFSQMARRFPKKNMFEIIFTIFGRFLGTIVNLILLLHIWLILMRDLRSFGKFINTVLLPNTPEEIVVLLFMLLLMFYGRSTVEVIGRVNDIFFPFFILLMLLLPLLLSNELHKRLVEPILTLTRQHLSDVSMLGIGWYGDIFIVGAFLHTIWSARQVHSAIRHGALLATFILILTTFVEVLVLGSNIPGNMIYPMYSLVQQIHVTDFLDRLDLFMLSVWYPVTACKVILVYLAFLSGFASLIKKRDYTHLNTPVSLLLLLTTILAFKSTTDIFSFGNYSSPAIVLSYQPILFLLILLLLRRFPVPPPESQSSGQSPSSSSADAKPQQSAQKMNKFKRSISYRSWMITSNALIALSLGFIALGMAFSPTISLIGTLSGYGFGLCIVLCVGSTYMEIHGSKRTDSRAGTS